MHYTALSASRFSLFYYILYLGMTDLTRYISGYCFGGPFTMDLAGTDKVVAGMIHGHTPSQGLDLIGTS